MLLSLHVKNMALIREEEITFGRGLNILTGETGAGKSILIGSINVALGSENFKKYVPQGAESALVELVFESTESAGEKLKEMELSPEDGLIVISRKYTGGRAVSRVNGETVPLKYVRDLAACLIDIHGQNQHQSLLHSKFHRTLLDRFAAEDLTGLTDQCRELYRRFRNISEKIAEASMDDSERAKRMDLLQYEIKEIEEASLTPGEDEQLEKDFRRMENGQKIMEALSEVQQLTGMDSGAGDEIGRAARSLCAAAGYDEALKELSEELLSIEDQMNELDRGLSEYMDDFSYDEQSFYDTSQRLDLINHLKSKYGKTVEEILHYKEKNQEQLDRLENHEAYLAQMKAEKDKIYRQLTSVCETISGIRRKYAAVLSGKIRDALIDLNFPDVGFETRVTSLPEPAEEGMDEVTFYISLNLGMPMKPIWEVASGGELSRIMLAVKSVMADQDEIGTLIFDEIDTGISGRTAQKVSEKMNVIARNHQVICITHLAQIAAMADRHFEISKDVEDGRSVTHILMLSEEESVRELARILGGVEITDTVLQNAREMQAMAQRLKNKGSGESLPKE